MIEAFKGECVINDHGGTGSCDTSTLVFDKGHAIKYIIEYFSLTDTVDNEGIYKALKHYELL